MRGLVRTWLGVTLCVSLLVVGFSQYAYTYAFDSPLNMNAGDLSPRYAATLAGEYVLWLGMAMVVFVGFDSQHRHRRVGIESALAVRPFSNAQLLIGQGLALFSVTWLTIAFAVAAIQIGAALVDALGWFPVEPIEPISLLVFMVDGAVALLAWSAFVVFLQAVLRPRALVVLIAFSSLAIHILIVHDAPAYLSKVVSTMSYANELASDLAPRLPDARNGLHHVLMLVAAVAFVSGGAAAMLRSDDYARGYVTVGISLCVLAGVLLATLVRVSVADIKERDVWLAAQQRAQESAAGEATLERVSGTVRIEPGAGLDLDLRLDLTAPRDSSLDEVVLRFNPGQRVAELRVDDIPARFRHVDGVLTVELDQSRGATSTVVIMIRSTGVPDPEFAYLDSAIDWRTKELGNRVMRLGTAAGIFMEDFVALMAGVSWLPMPGMDDSPSPFFVDLKVVVPEGWRVAGASDASTAGEGAWTFDFRRKAPVGGVSLIAAPFERFVLEAEDAGGVEFELLLDADHLRNVVLLSDVLAPLTERLNGLVADASAVGLPYPYERFTVVEVPTYLRVYGGGLRMDTVLASPGMLLLREQGAPLAHLEMLYSDPAVYANYPGGIGAAKLRNLEILLSDTAAAGGGLDAWSRNLLRFQTAASGPGSATINLMGDMLATKIAWDLWDSYAYGAFSVYDSDSTADVGRVATDLGRLWRRLGMSGALPANGSLREHHERVWEQVVENSLCALENLEEPDKWSFGAWHVRTKAAARSIIEFGGRDRVAAALAGLRRDHVGRSFDAADFERALLAEGIDLDALLGDWLDSASLPSFVASPATLVEVLADSGERRYQVRANVYNAAETPGLVRLSHSLYHDVGGRSEPVVVPGKTTVAVNVISSVEPNQLWLLPYLSANREPTRIPLRGKAVDAVGSVDVLPSGRAVAWSPAHVEGVVVDDLDDGFSVSSTDGWGAMGALRRVPGDANLDGGLPVRSRRAGEWHRLSIPGWGWPRQTVVSALAGDGRRNAVFAARLPTPGRWILDFHVPARGVPNPVGFVDQGRRFLGSLGVMELKLVAGGSEDTIAFDGAASDPGWNFVAEFEAAGKDVRVEVSNRTDGDVVVADAIRFRRAETF